MSAFVKIISLLCSGILLFSSLVSAQDPVSRGDSFFISNKKGILGRITRSISVNGEYQVPMLTVNPFKKYHGKIIRTISVVPVGFNSNLNETESSKNNLPIKIANSLHLNTVPRVISKNLFFKEGQKLYALLVADNERFLREQPFLRDAIIQVMPAVNSSDSVDVVVLTRDVFSIGGKIDISSAKRASVELKEENLAGSGDKFSIFNLYDGERKPVYGYGAEFIKRNIKGSFINWENGFKTFKETFNSRKDEELNIYSRLEKPMASRYTATTGALEFSYNKTNNGYVSDSLYQNDIKYQFINADFWTGYNFGHNSGKQKDSENRLRHFVAVRGFFNLFYKVPDKYRNLYNYNYADINGFLVSYSLYRQNFYRTNFIFGFGRNEDVPEGINASVIGGFINKQGIRRAYYGLEMDASRFGKKSALHSYAFKLGGYLNNKNLQDIDLLLSANQYTRLRTMNPYWYNRHYFSLSYTRQIKPYLNQPLFLQSEYGLPYFRNGIIEGRTRTTARIESVFYNMKKLLGFRFAPFIFSDLSLLQPLNEPIKKTNGYTAFGGGVRTRNENLIFGTIELRGFIFPRVNEGIKNWKVDISTKLKFKYNSSFIRRPDFVVSN